MTPNLDSLGPNESNRKSGLGNVDLDIVKKGKIKYTYSMQSHLKCYTYVYINLFQSNPSKLGWGPFMPKDSPYILFRKVHPHRKNHSYISSKTFLRNIQTLLIVSVHFMFLESARSA